MGIGTALLMPVVLVAGPESIKKYIAETWPSFLDLMLKCYQAIIHPLSLELPIVVWAMILCLVIVLCWRAIRRFLAKMRTPDHHSYVEDDDFKFSGMHIPKGRTPPKWRWRWDKKTGDIRELNAFCPKCDAVLVPVGMPYGSNFNSSLCCKCCEQDLAHTFAYSDQMGSLLDEIVSEIWRKIRTREWMDKEEYNDQA